MKRKQIALIFVFIYLLAVLFSAKAVLKGGFNGSRLTALCIQNSLPAFEIEKAESTITRNEEADREIETSVREKTKKTDKPKVLIYHTHATESYLPSSSGNYHTTKEENTVREAGDVLQKALEEEGIGVVHNRTLHDNPSYDGSYSRSYETVKKLMKKYPSIICIVDMHRDATAAKTGGPVVSINGTTCAAYSYVISNTTGTYKSNLAFIKKLNSIGAQNFDGFSGEILERPYWYNQELCGKAVLLEMGNNRNNIKEVRRSARIYGKILARALKEN